MEQIEKTTIGPILVLVTLAILSWSPTCMQSQELSSSVDPEPLCDGQPKGTPCWMDLSDHPGCYVWNPDPKPGETAAWSGECSGGLAQGQGTLKWINDRGRRTTETTGSLQDGKTHGRWVEKFASGIVQEGPYVQGKRHGKWVLRGPDGGVQKGPFVEGRQEGHWVLRSANGTIEEGPIVKNKQHGQWLVRFTDGTVAEGRYVDNRKHGRWVFRFTDGTEKVIVFENGSLVEK